MTDRGTTSEAEVREAFNGLIAALNAGEGARVRALLSERPDALHVGSDPDEWWTTADFPAIDTPDSDASVEVHDVHVGTEGDDFAWVVGRGRFLAGSAERGCRFSAVFLREEGGWKVVQSHASVGVPNDELFA